MDRIFKVDADDKVYLYFDGKEVKGTMSAVSWKTTIVVDLPGSTQVIAVKGVNTYGEPGFLGSTDDGYIVTNFSWKCTNKFAEKWNKIGFHDSNWPDAYDVKEYSEKPVSGIDPKAVWIWTRYDYRKEKGDRIVYCRFTLF